MKNKIQNTILNALFEFKYKWNKQPRACCETDKLLKDKIKECDDAIDYIRWHSDFDGETKITDSVLEFIEFFHQELKILNRDGERVFLTNAQKRELYKIHYNNKVKMNWCRQSGKDTVALAYLIYLAQEKRQRILIDAPNYNQRKDMLDRIYSMSNCSFHLEDTLKFLGGGYITTSTLGGRDKFDVLFSNEYDYNLAPFPLCKTNDYGFDKMIVVSKKLKDCDFVESTINWDEIPGRDECFKQKMIESIGIESWNREFEVTEMCEEFTASKMRKVSDEVNCKADKKTIKDIEHAIKEKAKMGYEDYIYNKPLSNYIKDYFLSRGFDVEEIEPCHYIPIRIKISW